MQVNMQHFSEQYSVLVLYFAESLHILHFLFVVVLNVSRLGRRLHVDAGFDASKPLDMHDVFLDALSLSNKPIGPTLAPH